VVPLSHVLWWKKYQSGNCSIGDVEIKIDLQPVTGNDFFSYTFFWFAKNWFDERILTETKRGCSFFGAMMSIS